jgi:hypothetical protein
MKTRYWLAILPLLVMGAGAYALSLPQVSPRSIESSVTRTPELVEKAWRLPVAATYGHAVAWQSNGSLCGPASLANAFRSLSEPATTESEVLDDTGLCWTGYCIMGLTLDELADVARKNSDRKVTVLRDLTADEFREHLRLSNNPGRRYIINFNRAPIFGEGVGHHSPIGGYLEKEDLVFVLDVNQKFRPWLVERMRLFSAMDTFDGQKKRGLLLVE